MTDSSEWVSSSEELDLTTLEPQPDLLAPRRNIVHIAERPFLFQWQSDDLPAAAVVGLGGALLAVMLILGAFVVAVWRPQPLSAVEIVGLFGLSSLLLGMTLYLARLLLGGSASHG